MNITKEEIGILQVRFKRRNRNITGKVSLVQINVLNDTKVFCDKKYDEFALIKENKKIACGGGTFYDVDNVNEITQLNLGINYYFDKNKNSFIKCHEKCKTCSREFNDTNMNCDECIDNYFIRNDNCLEISNCSYNYYYDKNFNLNCIDRNIFCPDFKPYENKFTKECIENCDIKDLNISCNPTNNLISVNDTYQKILKNKEYVISLEEKLFINKEKFIIFGNNVTLIFTTSEIEKNELYINSNFSSIILGESENNLKKIYSIPFYLFIPILKIELLNNDSNIIDLHYELFNPLNFTQKLDLNLLPVNLIEITVPNDIKKYKMDLIIKTKNLGYNIFNPNDSFYNDICSVFTFNNSDISLSERKTLLDLSDENLCITGCNYSNFDLKTLRSICLCKIGSEKNNTIIENVINEEIKQENEHLFNLIKENIDISKASNIKVVKCFSIIFSKNLFKNNYGFYINFFMILFNIVIIFFSPASKIEKILNEYCNDVLTKMKKIYNNDTNNI